MIAKKHISHVLHQLQIILTLAVEAGYTDFYAGGAIGWDTYCAQMVLDLRQDYPNIALHLVLPCSKEEQTEKWTTAQVNAYDTILMQADSCEFITEEYSKDCMRLRNRRLVKLADCIICYHKLTLSRSGTSQTLRLASQKGISVINLSPDGTLFECDEELLSQICKKLFMEGN